MTHQMSTSHIFQQHWYKACCFCPSPLHSNFDHLMFHQLPWSPYDSKSRLCVASRAATANCLSSLLVRYVRSSTFIIEVIMVDFKILLLCCDEFVQVHSQSKWMQKQGWALATSQCYVHFPPLVCVCMSLWKTLMWNTIWNPDLGTQYGEKILDP